LAPSWISLELGRILNKNVLLFIGLFEKTDDKNMLTAEKKVLA